MNAHHNPHQSYQASKEESLNNSPSLLEKTGLNKITEFEAPFFNKFSRKIKAIGVKNILFFFVLLALLGVGTFFAVILPKLNLDNRQQASTGEGTVVISSPQHNQTFTVGQPATITLAVNTLSAQTDGAQIKFTLSNQTADNQTIFDPATLTATVVGTDSSGTTPLDELLKLIEPTATGVTITLFLAPSSNLASLTTDSPQPLLNLSFTPINPGTINIVFDQENSVIAQKNTLPPKDILKTVDSVQLTIAPLVVNTPPTAFIIEPTVRHATVSAGTTITFVGNGIDAQTPPEPEGLTYDWRLFSRSGTVANLTGKTVSHTMVLPQNVFKARFGLTLKVTDPEGLASTNSAGMNIDVITHNTLIAEPRDKKLKISVGEKYTFVAEQSTKDEEKYEWVFSDNPTTILTGKEVTREFTQVGNLEAIVTTKNSDGVADPTPEKIVISVVEATPKEEVSAQGKETQEVEEVTP